MPDHYKGGAARRKAQRGKPKPANKVKRPGTTVSRRRASRKMPAPARPKAVQSNTANRRSRAASKPSTTAKKTTRQSNTANRRAARKTPAMTNPTPRPGTTVSRRRAARKNNAPVRKKAVQSNTANRRRGKTTTTTSAKKDTRSVVRKAFDKKFAAERAKKGPGKTFTFKNPVTGKTGTFTTDYKKKPKKTKGRGFTAGQRMDDDSGKFVD